MSDYLKREKVKSLLSKVERPGMQELLEWLDTSGFYFAPASTRFHGSYEGGLIDHSLNVYETLVSMSNSMNFGLSNDSMIISALLHDVCKADLYYKEGNKYMTNRQALAEGHGQRSVMMIKKFMELKVDEEAAIRMHMGMFASHEVGTYIKEYPLKEMNHMFSNSGSFLVYGLHVADMTAAHFKDK